MNLKKISLSILFVVLGVGIIGCHQLPERPADLPELYPCKMTVTFGGKPIEDVKIALKSENPQEKWQSGGRTDKDGFAKLKTSFAYDGVPQGTYVVSFTKTEERVGNTMEEMRSLSLIPLKYGVGTSKETVEIKPQKNDITFTLDAGEELVPIPKGSVAPRMNRGK